MNITITENSSHFRIEFPYNPRLVDHVKRIPGRYYDGSDKVWKVPVNNRTAVEIFAQRFNARFGNTNSAPEEIGEINPLPELDFEIEGLKRKLFDFQKMGVAYILKNKRVIVGDQMGLGKTIQSIAAMEHAKPFPCLIICPSSLKLNWQREISIWTNRKSVILSDTIRNTFHIYFETGIADYFIVNFESLKKYFVESIDIPKGKQLRLDHVKFKSIIGMFKSVIIDESHRVKAIKTQQTKFTKGICNNKEWILALTGTPVVNKPVDLIAQLGIIDQLQLQFGGYKKFIDRYCSGQRQASNLRELNYKLKNSCFYRRDKTDVMKDLPSKMRQVVLCEINTRKEYTDAESNLARYLTEYKNATDDQVKKSMRGEIMVRIGVLKNISARGKLDDVFDFINNTLESGEKLSIWGDLHQVIDIISSHYPHAVKITGRETIQERQRAVDEFQNNPDCNLVICGIKAAGVGLTLTSGSRCGFVELGWHAAVHDQCEDRHHRIGQTDSVQCTYFLGRDTIDEWIYKIIDEKRDITNTITGAQDDVEVNIVDNIINLFNQK